MSTAAVNTENTSKVDVHLGHVLLNLANRYPDLRRVILEGVQNALDSNATFIHVVLNYKERLVTIRDNGDGTTQEEFERALSTICVTKKDAIDSLGRFGIGLICPLDKCDEFHFTSTPKINPNLYKCWIFNGKEMAEKDVERIPFRNVPEYIYGTNTTAPRGKKYVAWRTEVKMINLIRDSAITNVKLASLKEGIIGNFGEKMKKLKTVVRVKIVHRGKEKRIEEESFSAPDFEGDKLDTVKYFAPLAGKIMIDVYVARKIAKKGRTGKVFVGALHDIFRMPFSAQTVGNMLSRESVEILDSGVFEGTMRAEKVKLNSGREHFELNDALHDFCKHIEKWCKEVGSEYVEKAKDESRNELWENTGTRSLKAVEDLLKLPEYKDLKDVFGSIQIGVASSSQPGFAKGKKLTDLKDLDSIYEEESNAPEKKDPSPKPEKIENKEPKKTDLTEKKRKMVQKKGVGLKLYYEEMSGKSVLWEFDLKTGSLYFNVRHWLWVRSEKKERVLIRLQEYIIVTALTIETMHKDLRSAHQQFAQQQLEYIIPLVEAEQSPGRR